MENFVHNLTEIIVKEFQVVNIDDVVDTKDTGYRRDQTVDDGPSLELPNVVLFFSSWTVLCKYLNKAYNRKAYLEYRKQNISF